MAAPSDKLYFVPSAVIFRAWAAQEGTGPMTRRLMLKNDGATAVSFRISLPQHAAFSVSGKLVPSDAQGDEICNVSLPAGGSTALTVTLHREHADEIEIGDELCVRMPDSWLHVPLVALRDTQKPEGGDPTERRTAPGGTEYWSDGDSDDEQRQHRPHVQRRGVMRPTSAAQRNSSASADGPLTAAVCTEPDELDFYSQLLKTAKPPAPTAQPSGTAGKQPVIVAPVQAQATPPRALVPAQQQASTSAPPELASPGSSQPSPFGVSQRFSRSAKVTMVHVPATPARSADAGPSAAGGAAARAQAPQLGARAAAPPPVSKEEEDELAFYRSLMQGGGHGAPPPPAAKPSRPAIAVVDEKVVAARRAIEAGTYFVVGGMVCDARGRTIGTTAEVLGEATAPEPEPYESGGIDPALHWAHEAHNPAAAPAAAAVAPKAGIGGAFKAPPRIGGDGGIVPPRVGSLRPGPHAGMLRGMPMAPTPERTATKGAGAVRVQSSAPKPTRMLSEAEMQANWDALC